MSIPISQFIPPPLNLLVPICLFLYLYFYFCFATKFICMVIWACYPASLLFGARESLCCGVEDCSVHCLIFSSFLGLEALAPGTPQACKL